MAVGAPVHQGYEDPQDQAGLVQGEASEALCEATAHSGAGPAQELAWRLHHTHEVVASLLERGRLCFERGGGLGVQERA